MWCRERHQRLLGVFTISVSWEVGGLDEKGEGIQVQIGNYKNSHRVVKCGTGTTVNNIVITMDGVRWVLDLTG